MSDLGTTVGPDRFELELEAGSFPRDAVYAAAYAFTDRCYVRLDTRAEGRIGIVLRAKAGGHLDGASVAAELRNELLAQAWRPEIADDGRDLTAAITAGAFGQAGDLLAVRADDAAVFDDPLGIALSWEAKYAKKPPAAVDAGAPPEPPAAGEQGR